MHRWISRLHLIAKSSAVGVVATLVDLGLLALMVHALEMNPRIASPIGLAAGVLIQFIGNKVFAFGDRSPRVAKQALSFALVEVLAFVANLVSFDLAVRLTHAPPLAARVASTALVYFAVCLPLWARIFRPSKPTLNEAISTS